MSVTRYIRRESLLYSRSSENGKKELPLMNNDYLTILLRTCDLYTTTKALFQSKITAISLKEVATAQGEMLNFTIKDSGVNYPERGWSFPLYTIFPSEYT